MTVRLNQRFNRGSNNTIFATATKNGPVAEWLGSALQKLLQRFESARDLHKKGDGTSLLPFSI